ncbi:MAG TPA: hypothetical protein DIT25_03445 [Candidatus Moranbacteria bacterium]|nr:hypothetical protein [Candidatus Moranbacteria bacterium]
MKSRKADHLTKYLKITSCKNNLPLVEINAIATGREMNIINNSTNGRYFSQEQKVFLNDPDHTDMYFFTATYQLVLPEDTSEILLGDKCVVIYRKAKITMPDGIEIEFSEESTIPMPGYKGSHGFWKHVGNSNHRTPLMDPKWRKRGY